MFARRSCVVLLLMWSVVPCVANAQQAKTCASTIPANIRAGLFTQDVLALLQSSATFRAQCERIAAAREARVTITLVQSVALVRAETTFTRYEAGALRADVRIQFGPDYRELIGHEFEHVIEQLDGVNLRAEAMRGGAWSVDVNVYETRRASDAGERVRRESDLSEARLVAVVRRFR
jgi:hypothetical protein